MGLDRNGYVPNMTTSGNHDRNDPGSDGSGSDGSGSDGSGSDDAGSDDAGFITDDQLPEELRPENDPFADRSNDEQGGADRDDRSKEQDGDQVSEPATEMAPGAEPDQTEPTG